jgi:hypothetical protein
LWGTLTLSDDNDVRYGIVRVEYLFETLREEKMYELLRAFVDDDPPFPLNRHPICGCFLHCAILEAQPRRYADRNDPNLAPHETNVSSRVMLLLAVPGTARVLGEFSHLYGNSY